MKTFNILSLETGKLKAQIKANCYEHACELASEKFDCYAEDEFFIETAQETIEHDILYILIQ